MWSYIASKEFRVGHRSASDYTVSPWLLQPKESPTVIAKEPDANPHKAASNPNMEWLISIIGGDDPKARSKCRIQKVPARFRENKKNKYFIPQVVSLGPYHHSDYLFKTMEKHKITTARRFILYNKSKLEQDTTQVMDNLFKEVMNVVAEARKFYAAEIMSKLRDEAFARMMFLDGCFVLYFIQGMNRGNIDLEISNRLILLIVRDMFLLENHLPLLVLDALMSLRFDSNKKLKGKIVKFIEWEVLLPMGLSFFIPHWWFTGRRDDDPLHLLDAFQTMLLGSHPSNPNKKYRYRLHNFGSVMELKEVGIMFEKSDSGYLTDS
ncbi:uncharacterized protein LOC131218208 [Magnolia sinica]|uniref:uncharacterized protein LOC131218208 n=1 Tax=Magnolia sinica TaxID=86752 RepID=UPI00265ACF96|nr:uncharacterized protein LOC131218208 [Magnolia sinica]